MWIGGTAGVALAVGAAGWILSRSERPFNGTRRLRVAKRRPDMPGLAGGAGPRVSRAVTIGRAPGELYDHWRDFSRLPDLLPPVESVTELSATRSRWTVRGPRDESGRLDPTFVISHRWPLSRAPEAYRMFNDKTDDCTKVVLDPTR